MSVIDASIINNLKRRDLKELGMMNGTIKKFGGAERIKAMPLDEKLMVAKEIVPAKGDSWTSMSISWAIKDIEASEAPDKQKMAEKLDEAIKRTEVNAETFPGMKRSLNTILVTGITGIITPLTAILTLFTSTVAALHNKDPREFLAGLCVAAGISAIGYISIKFAKKSIVRYNQAWIDWQKRLENDAVGSNQ